MPDTASKIRFKAKLLRPAETGKGGSWTFLILPKIASARLPSRGMTAIEGTLNDIPFQAMVEPDGQKSHWLKVDRKLREAAGAEAGDIVTLEIASPKKEPEPTVPPELKERPCHRRPQSENSMVGHHTHGSPGLDPLDHLRQAAGNACPQDQKCLLDAGQRQTPSLLLRPLRVLQQKPERSQSSDLVTSVQPPNCQNRRRHSGPSSGPANAAG